MIGMQVFTSIFIYLYFNTKISLINGNTVDDDIKLTVVQLIRKYGFPCETHYITTEDGYVLQIHRIPGNNSKPRDPIILHHGLLGCSMDWIIAGVNNALAYQLAKENYDVWLMNNRGNRYSRNHTHLDPDFDKKEFWNFSWHEIGVYDIPALIDYVLTKTSYKMVFHVGHSQANTAFFVMGSERPEYNRKVRAQFALAPNAYLKHMKNPLLRILARMVPVLESIFTSLEIYEFPPVFYELARFLGPFCKFPLFAEVVCSNVIFLIMGYNRDEMNTTLLPLFYSHYPAGAALKQIFHYGQTFLSGHFQQYNYAKNYELGKIDIPEYIFHSHNDLLVGEKDIERLCRELPNLKEKFTVPDKTWNHIDFVTGISVLDVINIPLMSTIVTIGLTQP